MILYSGPLSMFGAKTEIAVLEKGLDVRVEMVPFNLQDLYEPKHPEVARINPKQQVPVLKDGDLELFDSTQIFEYLEEAHPTPPLWPSATADRALARQLELWSDEIFFGDVQKLIPTQRQLPGTEPAEDVTARINGYWDVVEKRLSGRDYLADDFSYADIAFYPAQFFAEFLGAPAPVRLNNVHAWRARMTSRDSVSTVMGAMAAYLTSQGVAASL